MSSSHGFQGGGGGDQATDDKVDSVPRFPNPNSHIRPHIAPSELYKADFKAANIQTVKTVMNRPIAPAPVGRITQHVAGVSAATQLLASPSHNILTKMPAVLGLDGTHTAPTASIPNIAGHQTVTVAVSSVNSSTSTGVPSIRGSLTIPTPVSLPSGSSLVHQHAHSVQVPMASLIRNSLPAGGSAGLTQQTVTSIGSHFSPSIQPMVQPFTSHVPRGAAAASALHQSISQSALAVPKTAAIATAVLRPSTPVTMQIPFCTSVTTISTTAPGVLQGMHPQIGQRVVMAPVRSVTPPLNRSTSPSVSIPGGAIQHHAEIQHRPVLTPASTTTVGGSTVQISIHQPRVGDVARVADVTALHHQPRPIQASDLTRPLLSQLNVATAHKQHGTTAALLQPSVIGQHNQAVTMGHMSIGQPAGTVQSPNLTQPVTVGLTTGIGQAHMQKIVTTSITSHPVTTTKVGAAGQIFGHNPSITRPQKIVMSATPGPMVDPVTKKLVMSGAPSVQVISKAATATIGKQKMLMTPHQAALAGIHPTQTPTPTGVTPVLNLSQTIPRQQKMVVSQVTVPSAITTGGHVVTVPKPITPVATTMPAMAAAISMAPTTTTIPTIASIPVAKVTPQRQISVPASPQQTHVGAGDAVREQTLVAGATQVQRRDQLPAVSQQQQQQPQQQQTQQQPQQATSMFIPQMHRGSPNPSVPPATTTAINLSATFTESRPQERLTALPHYHQYQLNEMANYSPTIINYSNIVYPPQVAAQAFASISSAATSIRPGLVPNSNPNLTATLQAAAAHGVTVSSSQGGVRINPLMVTVDPSRHPSLAVHTTQYAPPSTSAEAASETAGTGISSAPSTALQTQQVASSVNQQAAPTNLTASPRPSILRKRPNDAVTVVKKNLLGALTEASAMQTDHLSPSMHPLPAVSPKPSIHDPSRENSQSSTDTATSAESTPKSATTPEIKIKQEPVDSTEGGTPAASGTPNTCNSVEASPRKKPRKQLLNATEELKDGMSSDEEVEKTMAKSEIKQELETASPLIKREEMSEYVDDEGVRWVCERKRPNIALLNHYQVTWKPKNNHFLRYTDVKPKEERRPTVNELSNQRCVVQKASGWKVYHLASQLETMMELEQEVRCKMAEIQDSIAPKHIAKHTIEDDIGMVHELTQGNIQRCKLVIDQLAEARSSMMNVLDHKKRILDIIQKHHSKRPVKKKERS